MRIPCALSLLLALAISGPTSAQQHPDFTGTWVLADSSGAAATVPAMLVVRESFRRESASGAPLPSPVISMHIDRHAGNGDVTADDFTMGIVGGFVSGIGEAAPVRRNFAATWDNDRLVLETTWSGRPVDAGTSSLHRETWALDRDGVLTVTTKESIGLADVTTTVSYRRQP